jgi:hypothetical protein
MGIAFDRTLRNCVKDGLYEVVGVISISLCSKKRRKEMKKGKSDENATEAKEEENCKERSCVQLIPEFGDFLPQTRCSRLLARKGFGFNSFDFERAAHDRLLGEIVCYVQMKQKTVCKVERLFKLERKKKRGTNTTKNAKQKPEKHAGEKQSGVGGQTNKKECKEK